MPFGLIDKKGVPGIPPATREDGEMENKIVVGLGVHDHDPLPGVATWSP